MIFATVVGGEIQKVGREYTATVHHDLSPVWSIFVKTFIEEAMRSVLGLNHHTETSVDSVTARFEE